MPLKPCEASKDFLPGCGVMRMCSISLAGFDHFGKDEQAYGYATGLGISKPCEEEVVDQLLEIHRRATEYVRLDGRVAMDDYFYAWQNAKLVRNAERYYRSM